MQGVPVFLRIPLVVFVASLVTGLLMGALVHFSMLKASERNISEMQKMQLPVLKQLLSDALKKKNRIKGLKSVSKSLRTAEADGSLTLWDADLKPLYHSNPEIHKQISRARKDKNLSLKDVFVLKQSMKDIKKQMAEGAAPYISEQQGSEITLFAPIPVGDEHYYFRLQGKTKVSSNNLKIILSVYLIAILMSIVVGMVGFVGSHEILKPVRSMVRAIARYLDTGEYKNLPDEGRDELGDMTRSFNSLVQQLGGQSQTATAHATPAVAAVPSAGLNTTVKIETNQNDFLFTEKVQNSLYAKPMSRFKGLELAMYPRRPHQMSHSFISTDDSHVRTNIFYCHFDQNDFEANILKARVQERFYGLSFENTEPDPIAENLYELLKQHSDAGPGMLYLQFDPMISGFRMVHSGPFFLYLVDSAGAAKALTLGETYFETQYNGLEDVLTENQQFLVIISSDVLAALNLNAEEIHEKFLANIASQNSARAYLAQLLNKVYNHNTALQAADKLPGIITVLSWKK